MFVRWKKRKVEKGRRKEKKDTYLTAVLVESIRIDGKPRQKFIRYLGSIPQSKLNTYYFLLEFWQSVDKNLEDIQEANRIQENLIRKVPRPTQEMLARELGKMAKLGVKM